MPETTFTVGNYSGNKVILEMNDIRSIGPDYPRLIFCIRLILNPFKEQKILLLNAHASLTINNTSIDKISDSVPTISPYKVSHPGSPTSYVFEFPLDCHRISILEANRVGDIGFRIDIRFLIGLYHTFILQDGNKQDCLTNFENPVASLNITIPQSHWVKQLLPALGNSQYFIVEIPQGKKEIEEAWNYISQAEEAFSRWDVQGVLVRCREVGTLLNKMVKTKFNSDSFIYKQRWGRAYGNFNHWASLGLHIEDLKKPDQLDEYVPGKADAEYLLIVTKCLIKYAEDLLKEQP